jgi:hypothetical protein
MTVIMSIYNLFKYTIARNGTNPLRLLKYTGGHILGQLSGCMAIVLLKGMEGPMGLNKGASIILPSFNIKPLNAGSD